MVGGCRFNAFLTDCPLFTILVIEEMRMTGKERVRRAMQHEEADRVPFFCQLALGHYMIHSNFAPSEIWHSTEAFGSALIELAEQYGMDGILVNLPGRPQDWRQYVRKRERKGTETVLYWKDGTRTRCPDNDNAHHISSSAPPDFGSVDPEALYYIDPHNMTGIKYPFYYDFTAYGGTEEAFFPDYVTRTLDYVISRGGNRFHISAEVFSPFSQLMEFFGYGEALLALMIDSEKAEKILSRLVFGTVELARKFAEAGADAILVSSAFAGGGFISRDHYRQFVLPYEKEVIARFREGSDVPVYVHTCGSIGDRIDLIAAAGYDGVDTMDPPPLGDTDLETVKREYGDRLFLKGNIDPVNIILNGSPREVYDKASECIESAAAGGGYILSSACSVAPAAPPENIIQMHQASLDHSY